MEDLVSTRALSDPSPEILQKMIFIIRMKQFFFIIIKPNIQLVKTIKKNRFISHINGKLSNGH